MTHIHTVTPQTVATATNHPPATNHSPASPRDRHASSLDDVFDEPARWRAASIRRAALDGEDRMAAASPSPAFPQLLAFALRAVERAPEGVVIDVGAGLGGVASAIASASSRSTMAFEPSWGSCDEARQLFPELPVVRSVAGELPVRDGGAAVVMLSGVVSLLEDATDAWREAARVVAPGGSVIVLDLVAAGANEVRTGPNRFRAVEGLVSELASVGLDVADLAVAAVEVGRWSELGDDVNRDVARRHRGEPGFDRWLDDHRHVARVLASGRVLMAGVAAVRRTRR